MQNMKLLAATLVITLGLVFGVGWILSKMFASTPAPNTPGMTVDESQLMIDSAPTKGAGEDARFTIVEFSDFECPACAATSPAISSLVSQYPDQVRVVYRHFPLISIHDSAVQAARFAEAAALQGKFWEMHDELFSTQISWSGQSQEQNREYFLDLGEKLGLNREQLANDVQSDAVVQKVDSDLRVAEQLGLSFTPSLFLNGQMMNITEIQQAVAAGVQASVEESTDAPTIEVSGEEEMAPQL
jgi:protein-disulfide isomerase